LESCGQKIIREEKTRRGLAKVIRSFATRKGFSMETVNGRLLEALNAKDDLVFKLGDTLDVKSSIVMVVITFVGTETAYFFTKDLSGTTHVFQCISVFFLVLATVFSIAGLWPRDYWMMKPEDLSIGYAATLRDHYSQNGEAAEQSILDNLISAETDWAIARIKDNGKINKQKAQWLNVAFGSTALAILFNVLTLVWFTHLF
jgi:hypothetical protein